MNGTSPWLGMGQGAMQGAGGADLQQPSAQGVSPFDLQAQIKFMYEQMLKQKTGQGGAGSPQPAFTQADQATPITGAQ